MNAADERLRGLIDLHVHTAPDVVPRRCTDVEAAQAAADAGMAAIMIKSHVTLTSDRASLAESVAGGVRVFGGLALNAPVGGLNPAAVEAALAMGARQIWMPTRDSAHDRRLRGLRGGISVLDDEGRVRAPVYDILGLVRESEAILGTGHLAPAEVVRLVHLARARGLRRILVTHPESPSVRLAVDAQRDLAGEGVYFERCYLNVCAASDPDDALGRIASEIMQVGVTSSVLATDLGQAEHPSPVEGMRAYLSALATQGLSWKDLRHMAGANPATLLGLAWTG